MESKKPQHSYKGIPLQFKTQLLVRCENDSPNPDLGKVEAWVKKNRCYWAKNIQKSGNYKGELVFDLFDNQGNPVKPNETYQKWRSNRFILVAPEFCLN